MANQVTQRKWDLRRSGNGTAQALTQKLRTSVHQGSDRPSEPRKLNLNRANMERESSRINQDILDAESVYQQLPDIELAEQVLVGSILSPKDMVGHDLTFSVDDGLFDSELSGPLLKEIKAYFNRHYNLDERLDEILTRVLFKQGADVYIILPENALDEMINGADGISMEQFRKIEQRYQLDQSLGILGHPSAESVSLEHYQPSRPQQRDLRHVAKLEHLTITDNFDVLKRVNQRDRMRRTRMSDAIRQRHDNLQKAGANLGLEARGLKDEQIDALYKTHAGNVRPSVTVTPTTYAQRPSVGHAMIMNPPMGSVIPVHVPGDPTDHVGYFLLIDPNTGRPIEPDPERDYYNEFRTQMNGQNGDGNRHSDVLNAVKQAMGHGTTKSLTSDEFRQAYETVITNELNNRFRNGIYQEGFDVAFTQEIYDVMLSRAFTQQRTELVYIPAEFVVYFAFDFDRNGTGKSLLKQTALLSSMRSVLLFADTMRAVRDAIGRKRATIGIPEDDPDPQKTISDIQGLILENTRRGFPLGSDPAQVMDFLNMAGYDFKINIEGNNYPGTTVEFDDYQTNSTGGNNEQEDKLRRLQAAGFGLNPEQIDPTQSPDFAVGVTNNNLIFTRRVLRYQKRFCRLLEKYVQTLALHSPQLLEILHATVTEGKSKLTPAQKKVEGKVVIEDFLDALQISLPSPDLDQVNLQLQAYEQYDQLLNRALDAYITPEIFPDETLARGDGVVEQIRSIIRSYFLRRWLEKNGVTPELMVLLETENQKPAFDLFDITNNMNRSLGKAIQRFVDGREKFQEKNEKKYGQSEEPDDGDFGGDTSFGDDGAMEDEDAFNLEEEGDDGEGEDALAEEGEEVPDETSTDDTEEEIEEDPDSEDDNVT